MGPMAGVQIHKLLVEAVARQTERPAQIPGPVPAHSLDNDYPVCAKRMLLLLVLCRRSLGERDDDNI